MGCYRQGDCADPEVFATGAVAVLSHYPVDIVRKITDPHSGLPGRLKWLPTIYEIREACEIENGAARRRDEQDARIKEQFAERDRLAAMDPAERRREFAAKWRAENLAKLGGAGAQRAQPPNGDAPPTSMPLTDFTAPLRLSDAALATAAGHAPQRQAAE